MKAKNIIIKALTFIMLTTCIIILCACNTHDDDFEVPSFTNVGEMLDAIADGTFTFKSVTLEIEEYDENNDLVLSTSSKCNENISYSESKTDVPFGITTTSKMYAIPDLTDDCLYVMINNFITNGWSFSKEESTLEGFNGSNLAPIALKAQIESDEIDRATSIKIENNVITFETATYKFTIRDFNSTKVELIDEVKDYKSKC